MDDEENADDQLNELDFRDFYGFIANEELVTVRPYLGDEDDRVLEELRPKYVVLYDPSPAFVRRIEVRLSDRRVQSDMQDGPLTRRLQFCRRTEPRIRTWRSECISSSTRTRSRSSGT